MAGEFEVIAGGNAPLVIGAQGMDDIVQCIRVIVLTSWFSCPLDRGFANTASFVDSPLPHAVAARMAELTEAIEKYEPRVRVTSIKFQPRADEAVDGRLFPVIRFRLKEGKEGVVL
jgi:phage baseplate assembly protein W